MKNFSGDVLDALERGTVDVVAHCANQHKTFGSGIAKSIRIRFPGAYVADVKSWEETKNPLGSFSSARVMNNSRIYNLYAQEGIGNNGTDLGRNCRYDALYDAVYKMCQEIKAAGENKIVGFPYKIASDRAGGSWRVVESILADIEEKFSNCVEFHIFKL